MQEWGTSRQSPLPFTGGWLGTPLLGNIPGPHCAQQVFMERSHCLPPTLPWGFRHPTLLEALCPLSAPGDQDPMGTPVPTPLTHNSFSVSSWVAVARSSLSSTSSLLGTHHCSWWGWGVRVAAANTGQCQCPRDHVRGGSAPDPGWSPSCVTLGMKANFSRFEITSSIKMGMIQPCWQGASGP